MIPTPTEILYFVETYRTKHVTRAAIRLGVTQPTLTQSLRKLEEKLRTRLFLRTRQGVVPTGEGTRFYSKARALLDAWDEINETLHASKHELSGRFRLGCHPSVGAYVLPTFLENLTRDAAGIEVNLIHDVSRKITEAIIAHEVDLGFVVNPAKHPDLVLKRLGSDRVTFWKKRGLSRFPRILFADVELIQVERLLEKTREKVFSDWRVVHTSSLELIRTLTLSGQGIGILPERVALADTSDLVTYDQSLPTYDDGIYLAYRKEVLSSRAGKALIQAGLSPLS